VGAQAESLGQQFLQHRVELTTVSAATDLRGDVESAVSIQFGAESWKPRRLYAIITRYDRL
jgi:hypothetical protein